MENRSSRRLSAVAQNIPVVFFMSIKSSVVLLALVTAPFW